MKRKHTAVRIHLPCPGWGSLLIHVGSQDDVGMLCMNCGEAALQKKCTSSCGLLVAIIVSEKHGVAPDVGAELSKS